jgi:hypothetical protein
MSETRTYAGGCHCGKVRFEVQTDFQPVVSCNCSICAKMGWLLTFVPAAKFTLLSGQEVLSDYQFGKKHVHHVFCGHCGIRSFGHGTAPDGSPTYAVNVRCLEGVDLGALTITPFDGKSL